MLVDATRRDPTRYDPECNRTLSANCLSAVKIFRKLWSEICHKRRETRPWCGQRFRVPSELLWSLCLDSLGLPSWRVDVHHTNLTTLHRPIPALFPLCVVWGVGCKNLQQTIRRGRFGLCRGAGYLAPNAGAPGTLQVLASAGADRSPGGEDSLFPFAGSHDM